MPVSEILMVYGGRVETEVTHKLVELPKGSGAPAYVHGRRGLERCVDPPASTRLASTT